MNIVAGNTVIPERVGGEVWFGKIADSIAENYVRPDSRYETMAKFDGHIAEAMSFKPVDRSVVRSREVMLTDGQAYNTYMDPHFVAAQHMWRDMEAYKLHGQRPSSMESLRVRLAPQ